MFESRSVYVLTFHTFSSATYMRAAQGRLFSPGAVWDILFVSQVYLCSCTARQVVLLSFASLAVLYVFK